MRQYKRARQAEPDGWFSSDKSVAQGFNCFLNGLKLVFQEGICFYYSKPDQNYMATVVKLLLSFCQGEPKENNIVILLDIGSRQDCQAKFDNIYNKFSSSFLLVPTDHF